MIRKGKWFAATGGDILSGLFSLGRLPDIQEDGEVMGSDAPVDQKINASAELIVIGGTWYFGVTGDEIVPRDPKKFRIAPMGKQGLAVGMGISPDQPIAHYHRQITGPNGNVISGGSYKWHRPWQKGF
jgi:hypothetical protein